MEINHSSTLTQLLVSEAVRELEKRFESMTDQSAHVEAHLYDLGKKPGFAITAQLYRNATDSHYDIVKFISEKLTPELFGVKPIVTFAQNILTIKFAPTLPSWFQCIAPTGTAQLTPQQAFWFKAYAQFIAGVYTGALTHFGYKATATLDVANPSNLQYTIHLQDLDGTWEFAAMMHR